MKHIGQILFERKIIKEEEFLNVLSLQKRSGSRIGDIIIAQGITGYLELYTALAEHYGLPFVNLLEIDIDENLLNNNDIENYIQYRAIPYQNDGHKILVATSEYDKKTISWIKNNFGENAEIHITSPLDIRRAVEKTFGKTLEEESTLHLWKKNPLLSARVNRSSLRKKYLCVLLLVAVILLIWLPKTIILLFVAICSISFFISMLFKILIFIKGIKNPQPDYWEKRIGELDEASLPKYTILIPMYKEAESLPYIISSLENLDYPPEKLDIKLVLEDDDDITINKALELKPRHNFDIIKVPLGFLRTKPKACNYALNFAKGEYVTIFDADDIPEKSQLKKAVITFNTLPEDVICLQARLNYYNYDDNLLTRLFSLEYSILFDVMLHGMEKMNIPLPLGGTSNHIALRKLKDLGMWDAYNVTEDADLGIRLYCNGFRTAMLDSYTMEEAPVTIYAWIRQRSRWIKGYMQTWLVHMRNPVLLYRNLGRNGFIGFQLFIGFSALIFLTAPILWAFVILWWFLPQEITENWLPQWLIFIALTNLFMNFIIHWFMMIYCVSLKEYSSPQFKIASLFYPFYLLLHSVASYKSLWQLFVKPYFWEKTTHGCYKSRIEPKN